MDVQYLQRTTKLVNDMRNVPSGYLHAVQETSNKILSPQMSAIVLQSRVKTPDSSLSTAASSTLLVTRTDLNII